MWECFVDMADRRDSSNFTIKEFYGRRNCRKRRQIGRKLDQKARDFQEQVLLRKFQPRIIGPSSTWQTFFKQKDAFSCARKLKKDLQVFAYESETFSSNQGQRMYLVCSYPAFWHYYRQLKPEQRCHYEVIPEGSVCKLYFDLEFLKQFNPEKNGPSMVNLFIKYTCAWLRHVYGIFSDHTNVINLDASTEKKFSCHLIFVLGGAAFRDNTQAGYFVRFICTTLLLWVRNREEDHGQLTGKCRGFANCLTGCDGVPADRPVSAVSKTNWEPVLRHFERTDLGQLLVRNKDNAEVLFCDLGVYTRNRNFRLVHSRKLGKHNPLAAAAENQYIPSKSPDSTSLDEKFFMDSIITNVPYEENLRILTFDSVGHSRMEGTARVARTGEEETETVDEGCAQSPYPKVDAFITSVIQHKGERLAAIRRWFFFTCGGLLIYDIAHNRWCGNIRRQHRSNNIMLIVDLRRGVYYQKCHDPECRLANYRSEDKPLPWELLEGELNASEDELGDEALVAAASSIEEEMDDEQLALAEQQ